MKKCALIATIAFIMCSCSNNRIRCGEYEATCIEEYTYFDEYGNITREGTSPSNRPIEIYISKDESNEHDFRIWRSKMNEGSAITYADVTKHGIEILPCSYYNSDYRVGFRNEFKFVKSKKDTIWIDELYIFLENGNLLQSELRHYKAVKK